MNGFQAGFIDSILELDSYHIRVSLPGDRASEEYLSALAARLREDDGVSSALVFSDFETVALARNGRAYPLRIKALSEDAEQADPGLLERLSLREGKFIGSPAQGIVLGSELARQLDVYPGDEVSILSVTASEEEGVIPRTLKLPVIDIFRSGYYNFDHGMGFVSFRTAAAFGGHTQALLGVKLKDRYADERFAGILVDRYGLPSDGIVTWRVFNRSFFGALRMEKTAMMLLVGLIFVVVAVNIYHSMRKNIFERMEDIAVLKALGGSGSSVRRVFVLDGLATGLLGSTCGMILGQLMAVNINEFFGIVETFVNAAMGLWRAAAFRSGPPGGFQIFSPTSFYLIQIPAKIVFPETLFIFSAGAASAAVAAWAASRRVLRFRPAEVLRNE